MKSRPLRTVLAFYSSRDEPAERALDTAHATRFCVIRADGEKVAEWCRPYALLRLEGETLAVVEAERGRIEAVVRALRLTGSPAIFVVSADPAEWTVPDADDGNAVPREPAPPTRHAILARLRQDSAELNQACADLTEAARLDHALSPAAEWILDNSYLIHTQITEVERHLPHDHKARHHKARQVTRNGHRGVSALARELVAKTGHNVTDAAIRECLAEYQTSHPLTIAQLWAFPLYLRVALIEALTQLARRVSRGQQLRESAYLWADRLATSARAGSDVFEKVLAYLEAEPIAR